MKGLKRLAVFTLAICMVLSLCLTGGVDAAKKKKKSKKAVNLVIAEKNLNMIIGDTYKLTVKNLTAKQLKKVKWSSSDKKVAFVNKKGIVKAKKSGTAIITAKYGKQTKTCKITVENVKINSLKIGVEDENDLDDDDNLILYLGEEADENVYELECTFTAKRGVKAITRKAALKYTTGPIWTSSNEKVATIDEDGIITMLAAGTTTITVQVGDKKATLKVIVSDEGDEDDGELEEEESDGDLEDVDGEYPDADTVSLDDYDLSELSSDDE